MVASLVEKDTISICDIGADNGQISIYLSNKGIKVYALENKVGPYNTLKKETEKYSDLEAIYSDGLDNFNIEVDGYILAGMGGINMIYIISKDLLKFNKAKYIILQANQNIIELKEFLMRNNFTISQESICLDSKIYYFAIKVIPNRHQMSNPYLFETLIDNPLYKEYINNTVNKLEKIILKTKNERIIKQYNYLKELL